MIDFQYPIESLSRPGRAPAVVFGEQEISELFL